MRKNYRKVINEWYWCQKRKTKNKNGKQRKKDVEDGKGFPAQAAEQINFMKLCVEETEMCKSNTTIKWEMLQSEFGA